MNLFIPMLHLADPTSTPVSSTSTHEGKCPELSDEMMDALIEEFERLGYE